MCMSNPAGPKRTKGPFFKEDECTLPVYLYLLVYVFNCVRVSEIPHSQYISTAGEAERGGGGGGSRGKALFQRCAAKTEEEKRPADSLPALDFQEIEEEFERIHREMLASDTL